jgi:hypothetical protein
VTTSNNHLTPISPPRCVVCRHEDRDAIDRDLIRKRRTQADIARQLDVDRSTISRHLKNHVLPTLASTMISAPAEVSIGSLIDEFDYQYGVNRQIQERALARDDLSLVLRAGAEQRRLLEVLLKHGEKMGAGSVFDAIGRDPERWAQLEREIAARYRKLADERVLKVAKGFVTLSELPEDVRDRITELVLRAEFPDDGPVDIGDAVPEATGGDTADSEANQDEDPMS